MSTVHFKVLIYQGNPPSPHSLYSFKLALLYLLLSKLVPTPLTEATTMHWAEHTDVGVEARGRKYNIA